MSLSPEARLNSVVSKLNSLKESGFKINAEIENAEQNLQALNKQAKEEYGTDNLDELVMLLEKMEAENEKIIQDLENLAKTKENEILLANKALKEIKEI